MRHFKFLHVEKPGAITLMFDTVIFNRIADGEFDISNIAGKATLLYTHIQHDELAATPAIARREHLLRIFQEITGDKVPTESFILDTSKLDNAKLSAARRVPPKTALWGEFPWGEPDLEWGADGGLYESIKNELDKKNKRKENNRKDALIAEASMLNESILVTEDHHLIEVVKKFSGRVVNLVELKSLLELDA